MERDRGRRRRRRHAIAMAGILAFGGCSDGNSQEGNAGRPTEKTPTSQEATKRIVDVSLPQTMPDGIKALVYSAVDIEVRKITERIEDSAGRLIFSSESRSGLASGVKITENIVATAGHALVNEDGSPKGHTCGDIYLHSLREDNRSIGSGVTHAVASVTKDDSKPDFALLRTFQSAPFAELPNARISDQIPQRGDVLFMINFQPDESGIDRNPGQAFSADHKSPAVYAGVMLGTTPTGDYMLLTGLKSYGSLQDASVRGGASGGLAAFPDGSVVGLVTQGVDRSYTQVEIETQFGIRFQERPESDNLTIAIVEPVIPELVGSFTNELDNSENRCIPTPPKKVIQR